MKRSGIIAGMAIVLPLIAGAMAPPVNAAEPESITVETTTGSLSPRGTSTGAYRINVKGADSATSFLLSVQPPSLPARLRTFGSPLEFDEPIIEGPGTVSLHGASVADPIPGICMAGGSVSEPIYKVEMPADSESTISIAFRLAAAPPGVSSLVTKISTSKERLPVPEIEVHGSTSWVTAWKVGKKNPLGFIAFDPGERVRFAGRAFAQGKLEGRWVRLFLFEESTEGQYAIGKAKLDSRGRFKISRKSRITSKVASLEIRGKLIGTRTKPNCALRGSAL